MSTAATNETKPEAGRYSLTRRPGYTDKVTYRPTFGAAQVAYVPADATLAERSSVLEILRRRASLWR